MAGAVPAVSFILFCFVFVLFLWQKVIKSQKICISEFRVNP